MAKSKQQKGGGPRQVRRINFKAVAILAGVLGLCLAAYFPIRALTDQASRRSALEQVRASIEAKDVDLALRRLDRFMGAYPDNLEGLELQAKLMADTARSPDQLIQAATLNDRLLRLDPDGAERQETRRRIVGLYIRHGDLVRTFADARNEGAGGAFEVRYRAAATIARQLLARGAEKDPASQRLLAMALDGIANGGDAESLREAVEHYREALKLDPADAVSAERLAAILNDKRNDPAGAEKVLDDLLKAKPDSVDVRLARFRFFARGKKDDRARAELEAAVKQAPADTLVLTTIASESLQRRDPASARKYLDAIVPADRDLLRVRTLRGMLDFAELKADDAVEQWRKGLTLAGGTDVELTWQLAYALIHLNRLTEARPLLAQFERLDPVDRRGMGRFLRAMFDHRSGHAARAIDGLEKARDRLPEAWQVELQLTLGLAYEARGDAVRAMAAFRRASSLAPQLAAPRREVARLLKRTDPKGAADELARALEATPNDVDLLLEVGRLQFDTQVALPAERRNWGNVERIVARLGQVAPNAPAAQVLRADLLAATDRLGQAVEMLARATQGDGRTRPEAWVTYANALERNGRRDDALAALEAASKPEAAGDHAAIRIARARLVARGGKGQAAREILANDLDRVPKSERGDLAKARGDLARELGDRAGARDAYAEWARIQPDSPRPGLTLLELAQVNDDNDAARLGLEALRALGGDQEPYGLAARAMDLIRLDRERPGGTAPGGQLDEADRLVKQLEANAPQIAIGPLLRGMIFERRNQLPEAAASYKKALADNAMVASTLPRLINLLVKLGKQDEIAALKQQFGDPSRAAYLDRLIASAAIRSGDKDQAEATARQILDANPDSVPNRVVLATLLDDAGKTADALALLRDGPARKPNDPDTWLALIAFEQRRGAPGDAAKTVDRLRASYRGDRPDLVLARAFRLSGDNAAAARAYDAAVKARPDDLPTLLVAIEFDEANGRFAESESALRRILQREPKTTWAARTLALRVVSKPGESAWNEAWSLIAPGAPGYGDEPEDRLIRSSILSKSVDIARRSEAIPALVRLGDDLPPSHPVGAEARIRLAQLMLDNNRPADAERFIAPLADDATRPNPNGLAIGVEAEVRTGQVDAAERRLERLAAIEPKSPRTDAARAWVLSGRGKMPEAVALIEASAAEAMASPSGETLAAAFRTLVQRLNQPEALVRLDKTIAARFPRLAYLYAQDKAVLRETGEALKLCRVAAEAGSGSEAIRVATVMALTFPDDSSLHRQIDSLIDAVLSNSAKTTDLLVMIATIRHVEGRYEDEVATYREALASNPSNFRFENNMAWTLSEGLKQGQEALARVDDVIRREGKGPAFLDTRGVILSRMGRHAEAIADLQASAASAPDGTTYYHLARALIRAGKPAEAKRAREQAVAAKFDRKKLDPTDRYDLDEVMGPG